MSLRRKRCIRCGSAPVKRIGVSVRCRFCGLYWYQCIDGIRYWESKERNGLDRGKVAPLGALLIFAEEVEG